MGSPGPHPSVIFNLTNYIYVMGVQLYTPYEGSIRLIGSWGYLTGSWREATPYFTDILRNIRVNEPHILNWCLLRLLNYLGIRTVNHNL